MDKKHRFNIRTGKTRRSRKIEHELVSYRYIIILGLAGIPIGAVIGLLETVFGKGLSLVTSMRTAHPMYYMPFLAVAGLIIAFTYQKIGGKSKKGMGIIFDVVTGHEKKIPLQMVPIVMVSSWLTHLCGGSAGREGVAVQIGAATAYNLGKRIPTVGENYTYVRDILIVSGMAAGFAGLFQTPIAAIFFALELLVSGQLRYKALFPIITADMTSYFICQKFGLSKLLVPISFSFDYSPVLVIKLILLGAVFGLSGATFAWCLVHFKRFLSKAVRNPLVKTAGMGLVLSVVFILTKQRYSGFGTNITMAALTGGDVRSYDFVLKAALTIFTLAAGFQGGELTPIFAIGSSLGFLLSGFFGLPPEFVAALGFSAMFGSATNTMLAPIFIGAECFGVNNIYYLIVVCGCAFIFNFNRSIYPKQRRLFTHV